MLLILIFSIFMINEILFSHPVLFLEFFVREYRFLGKGTVRTELPKDAFFYTGQSKAVNKGLYHQTLCFKDDIPYLSGNISEEVRLKLFKDNTNIVFSVGGECLDKDNIWHLVESKVLSNKSNLNGNSGQLPYANFKGLAPHNFNIVDVMPNSAVFTDFPRGEILFSIEKGQTLCFLCRQDERGDGDWYTPNINLVLFVRNYGFFDKIDCVAQGEIDRMDSAAITRGKISLRDFRKSKFNFELK